MWLLGGATVRHPLAGRSYRPRGDIRFDRCGYPVPLIAGLDVYLDRVFRHTFFPGISILCQAALSHETTLWPGAYPRIPRWESIAYDTHCVVDVSEPGEPAFIAATGWLVQCRTVWPRASHYESTPINSDHVHDRAISAAL